MMRQLFSEDAECEGSGPVAVAEEAAPSPDSATSEERDCVTNELGSPGGIPHLPVVAAVEGLSETLERRSFAFLAILVAVAVACFVALLAAHF
jgi:hypothetical protein